MRPSKKPKYKLDIRKIYPVRNTKYSQENKISNRVHVKPEEDLSTEELYKEQLTLKIKQRRRQ